MLFLGLRAYRGYRVSGGGRERTRLKTRLNLLSGHEVKHETLSSAQHSHNPKPCAESSKLANRSTMFILILRPSGLSYTHPLPPPNTANLAMAIPRDGGFRK